MTPQTQNPPAHLAVLQILSGLYVSAAVSCLARLGIPDLLEAGPKTAETLAAEIGAHPRALYRLMRATASVGVLSEGIDGTFSETPMSAALRTNATPNIRAYAIMNGAEWYLRGQARLPYCVRTGKQALDEIYGKPIFEFFQEHPEDAQLFNEAMTGLSTIDSPAVAAAYSFEGIRSIVDVAGGHGLLLATILAQHPQMKGTLYEIPPVIQGAKTGPLQPMLDRCTLSSGDIFSSVPAGTDAYIMKHIIHDWPDEKSLKILKACRAGVNPGGRLLVVDEVIQPGNDFSPGKLLDLQMMLFPGGCERTEQEFRELLAAAGWRLNRIIPTAASVSIVEGIPV